MDYKLKYSARAIADLKSIDLKESKKIISKLGQIINNNTNPMSVAKSLKGQYSGLYRFRVGNYRAIFSKDNKGNLIIIEIVTIGHRKNIYK